MRGVTGSKIAIVGFGDAEGAGWLRWLAPGFRHCLVALPSARGWVVLDPLSHRFDVMVVEGGRERVERLFHRYGMLTVRAPIIDAPRPAPPGLLTCVEAVKRAIGLHAPWILTPHQLFRHLTTDDGRVPQRCGRPAKGHPMPVCEQQELGFFPLTD